MSESNSPAPPPADAGGGPAAATPPAAASATPVKRSLGTVFAAATLAVSFGLAVVIMVAPEKLGSLAPKALQAVSASGSEDAKLQPTAPGDIVLEPEQERALDVRTVKALFQRGDHPIALGGRVSLDLEKTSRIRPLYNVTVYQVHKRPGELVKKGDAILTVESTDLGTAKNNYLTQIANLEVAATTYRREALLRLRHATTDVDYENARSGFRQAAVALMAAREQCLLMGVRPQELEELRHELYSEVLSLAKPLSNTSDPEHGEPGVTSMAARPDGASAGSASPWEGMIDMLAPSPDAAAIPSTCLVLKPATDPEREHDALVALAEISKRFASPRLKNEEDGRRRARYTIRTPIDGVVVSKDAAKGEFVDPSQVIVTVADTSDVWINLDVYQQQIASVESGARVDVTTPAYPERTFSGTISYVAAAVDDATHTLRARVEVANPDGLLKSGLVARCVVHSIDHEPRVEVPKEAILDDGGRTWAIVRKSPGHYERREVKLGLKTDTVVHVDQGLQAGDDVVLQGNLFIHSTIPLGD